MRTDKWTDMTQLIVAFHKFAKVPKNSITRKNFGLILKSSASGFELIFGHLIF